LDQAFWIPPKTQRPERWTLFTSVTPPFFGCMCSDTLIDPRKKNMIYVIQYDQNYFPSLVAYRSGKQKWRTELLVPFDDLCLQAECMDLYYIKKKYLIRIFNTSLKNNKKVFHIDLDPKNGKLIKGH
jgi:hypothetical protein